MLKYFSYGTFSFYLFTMVNICYLFIAHLWQRSCSKLGTYRMQYRPCVVTNRYYTCAVVNKLFGV